MAAIATLISACSAGTAGQPANSSTIPRSSVSSPTTTYSQVGQAISVAPSSSLPTSTAVSAIDVPALVSLVRTLGETHDIAVRAVRKQTAECAAAAGYTGEIIDPRLWEFQPLSNTAAPWLYPTLDNARKWGYTPGSDLAVGATEPLIDPVAERILYGNNSGEWNLTPEEAANAFTGQSIGGPLFDGCLPTAFTEIVGGGDYRAGYLLDDARALVESTLAESATAVTTAPEWLEVERRWVDCMSERGIETSGMAAQRAKSWNPPFTDQERREATADVECMQSVGAIAVGEQLLAKTTPPDKYLGLIEDFDTQLQQIRQRAQSVLSA